MAIRISKICNRSKIQSFNGTRFILNPSNYFNMCSRPRSLLADNVIIPYQTHFVNSIVLKKIIFRLGVSANKYTKTAPGDLSDRRGYCHNFKKGRPQSTEREMQNLPDLDRQRLQPTGRCPPKSLRDPECVRCRSEQRATIWHIQRHYSEQRY